MAAPSEVVVDGSWGDVYIALSAIFLFTYLRVCASIVVERVQAGNRQGQGSGKLTAAGGAHSGAEGRSCSTAMHRPCGCQQDMHHPPSLCNHAMHGPFPPRTLAH